MASFSRKGSQKGQATIFMVVFITTMILLFAFTTNIGMLVHAKINLQNAADAASFAGASVQARQLTAVGYLNFEMRRAIKQFLFNWMVRGNQAQACFPARPDGSAEARNACAGEQGAPNDRYQFSFRDPRDPEDFGSIVDTFKEQPGRYIPTTCIIFDQRNNYCQKTKVAGIPELGGITGVLAFVNPIINAVKNSTNIIINKKVNDCLSRTQANALFLLAWLVNLVPAPVPIRAQNDFEDAFPVFNTIDGMGVLLRLALLRARIDNFEEALNFNLKTEGLDTSTINTETINILLGDASKRAYHERPIQAYLSAKNNLPTVSGDNGIFSNLKVTELLPLQSSVPRNPNLINNPTIAKFVDITDNVVVAASAFFSTSTRNRGECRQERREIRIPSFLVGVHKDPEVLTYYAVNLKADTRLLFSPFGIDGTVTLSAYSAAKPFGSRIGKNLAINPDAMIHSFGKRNQNDVLFGEFSKRHQFINLLVTANNRNAINDGFASNNHLGYLHRAIRVLGNAGAFRLAGAYAPWEVGFYTIPADLGPITGPFNQFKGNPDFQVAGTSAKFNLRAPITPFRVPGSNLNFILGKIEAMFTILGFLTSGQGQAELTLIKQAYLNSSNFQGTLAFLRATGQDQVHPIPNPILNDNNALLNYARSEFTVFGPGAIRSQLTSWNTIKSSANDGGELGPLVGRSGYSVRFVGFSNLRGGGLASNDGSVNYTDPFARLSPGSQDAQKILDEITALRH